MFEVESGIPVEAGPSKRREAVWHLQYPFGKMKVGDSFLMPAVKDLSNSNLQSRALAAARKWGVKIKTKSVEGGVRVWRMT